MFAMRAYTESESNVAVLTDDLTLTETDKRLQRLDPNGATRVITLPAVAGNRGIGYAFFNEAAAAFSLTIKDADGTTLTTVTQGQTGFVMIDDTEKWLVVFNTGVASSATLAGPIITGLEHLNANAAIDCAAGTSYLDLSLGTGITNTTTGAVGIKGSATIAANKNLSCAGGTTALDLSLGTGVTKTTTGLNTFGGKAAFKVIATPVAAAVAAAALGSANIVTISSDGATKKIKLQTGVPGDLVHVLNTSGTGAQLAPASGGTINGLAPDAAVVVPASKGVVCYCTAADTWTVYDMTALATTA